MEGQDEYVEKCGLAVENPFYPLFLGRRDCIPSVPIMQGVFSTMEEAAKRILEIAEEHELEEVFEEADPSATGHGGGGFTVLAQAIDFEKQQYAAVRFLPVDPNRFRRQKTS